MILSDCRTCIKRRVKCDRTSPDCYKCQSRRLQCPGFGARLRWGQGIASRGKLKGLTRPIEGRSMAILQSHLVSTTAEATPLKVSAAEFDANAQLHLLESQLSSIPKYTMLNNRTMASALTCHLLQHFLIHVTPRLRWIDHDNPWRRLVLPLSTTSNCLHLAVLSLSATHLLATSVAGSEQTQALEILRDRLRNSCLSSLSLRMRHDLDQHCAAGDNVDQSPTTKILATMVVLSYVEFLLPEPKEWHLHLRACRATCDRQRLFGNLAGTANPVIRFLQTAIATFEVFEMPSSFLSLETPIQVTQITFKDAFWTFTVVLQEIKAREQSLHVRLLSDLPNPGVDMTVWCHRLEQASSLALSSTSSVWKGLVSQWEVFCSVVKAHYHAALIYAYQALVPPNSPCYMIDSALDGLNTELESILMGDVRDFDHDMFWPLFIAGTESRRNEARKVAIEAGFYQLISSTGFCCNYRALNFLRTFWSDPSGLLSKNWIEYARHNDQKFGLFLVY